MSGGCQLDLLLLLGSCLVSVLHVSHLVHYLANTSVAYTFCDGPSSVHATYSACLPCINSAIMTTRPASASADRRISRLYAPGGPLDSQTTDSQDSRFLPHQRHVDGEANGKNVSHSPRRMITSGPFSDYAALCSPSGFYTSKSSSPRPISRTSNQPTTTSHKASRPVKNKSALAQEPDEVSSDSRSASGTATTPTTAHLATKRHVHDLIDELERARKRVRLLEAQLVEEVRGAVGSGVGGDQRL
ncbi:hypothetical protein BV25DRAFT_1843588 [Artomyces pyxidatus]|uniref:Uncharacterized protein n=1 Tax=Artomyces pyxidatus TaxID=48021 RepID=A0ACB8SF38_9AGAM|nr:hypothetical protein BV25DRAFT_1843588 [Artomyces pyxidatus]